MRIAIISDGVHPYVIGGMQRHTYYLVKYLCRKGIYVTLIHYNQSDLKAGNLEVFSEEERKFIDSVLLEFPSGDKWPGHYVRASYSYSKLAYEKIKDRLAEFDFIYTKGFAGWKTIEEKAKNPGDFPPVSVKFHGYEMFQKQADFKSFLQSRLLRRPVRWISTHADYVFSYGSKITDIIRSLGVENGRIVEIPAGIEPEWLRTGPIPAKDGPKRFVYLGRYERRKGIEELNQALKELLRENLKFEFHFIGPFESSMQIHSENIRYHGVIRDNDAIRAILDGSDVLVCPSWSEGMPNVILEGMARATAVLATNVGANSIMIDHSNGWFVQVGSVKDLAQQIRNIIYMDDEKIRQMRNNSLTRVENELLYPLIINKFVTFIHQSIKK